MPPLFCVTELTSVLTVFVKRLTLTLASKEYWLPASSDELTAMPADNPSATIVPQLTARIATDSTLVSSVSPLLIVTTLVRVPLLTAMAPPAPAEDEVCALLALT